MMKVALKDGSIKEYAESKSVYEIALDISEGLARAACAGEVDGEAVFGTDRRIRFGPLLPDEDTSSKHIPLWHLPQPTRLFYVFTLCVFL